MVYFPSEIFTKILEYNNHSIENDQKKHMKEIIMFFAMKNYINTMMLQHMENGFNHLPVFLNHYMKFFQTSRKDKSIKGMFTFTNLPYVDCIRYKRLCGLYCTYLMDEIDNLEDVEEIIQKKRLPFIKEHNFFYISHEECVGYKQLCDSSCSYEFRELCENFSLEKIRDLHQMNGIIL
jgi:hypothetical protein